MVSKVVGILNITPDSFFDGGKYNQSGVAIKQIENLILQGANVIDIGAESTRPNAQIITIDQEWQRLREILPQAIKFISNYNQKSQQNIAISLDSKNFQTIEKAIELGIDIINDVSGFDDLEMIKLASKSAKKIVVMHNLGVPADKNKIIDQNLNVVEVVFDWIKNKLQSLQQMGVKKEQIIFDIGIGFGKNSVQSIELLKEINHFKTLEIPLYVGHSNKSFLDDEKVYELFSNLKLPEYCFENSLGKKNLNREEKTFAISAYLASKNIEYIRVHNVAGNLNFIKANQENR